MACICVIVRIMRLQLDVLRYILRPINIKIIFEITYLCIYLRKNIYLLVYVIDIRHILL